VLVGYPSEEEDSSSQRSPGARHAIGLPLANGYDQLLARRAPYATSLLSSLARQLCGAAVVAATRYHGRA